MLVNLVTVRRCGSWSLLSVKPSFCEISQSQMGLQPVGLEKYSREEYRSTPVKIKDIRLYSVHYLKNFIRRSKRLRQEDKLLVPVKKPHKAVSAVIVSRRISSVIAMPGQWDPGGTVQSM